MSLTIQLPKFEGPLALLLYLIRKEEMDIFDIKMNEITGQYLEYIKLMKELDIEMAGEFIAMAATLIHIKSKMLLPQYDENGEEIEQEDPRKELVQRLLEYQKYQEAGKNLYERPLLGRDVFPRGFREKLNEKEDEIVLEENALFALISAYRSALKNVKKKVHNVAIKAQSIASRIMEMSGRLIVGSRVAMSDFIDSADNRRRQVLITFLSLLELGKMGLVSLYQTDTYQEIYAEAKKPIEQNMLDRVEEYDSMHAAEVAAEMMLEAGKIDPNDELITGHMHEEVVSLDATPEHAHLDATTADEIVLNETQEFILPDELDEEGGIAEVVAEEEMATDDEILAAEMELDAGPLGASAFDNPVSSEPIEFKIADDFHIEITEEAPTEPLVIESSPPASHDPEVEV